MLRPLLTVLLFLALPAQAATRWYSERAGAPVRWQEWGTAALERARNEKKPIFLSIGFASCWNCFRMQQDAFSDSTNAALLNAQFVPLVLDRIEHPEIAEAYEHALKTLNGANGWPANLVLTPSLEPFDGGGFMDAEASRRMLVGSAERWKNGSATADARTLVEKARATAERRAPFEVDASAMEAVIDAIGQSYERTRTLHPATIPFLLRYSARAKHAPLRDLALDVLRKRAASPLRDQIGGGVHRCEGCFDKLLRDQALEALTYIDAWELTRDADFAHVARTTLDYVLRDLRFPNSGAFQASQDAHSLVPVAGQPRFVDGAFYLWDKDEVTNVLGDDAAGKIFRLYAMKEAAPNRPALEEPRFLSETSDQLAPSLQKLLEVRQKRPAPFREPLVIAGWNGLIISALSRFGERDRRYVDAAHAAAAHVTAKLWDAKKGTLARSDSGAPALAEDYALLVQGLLDLFEASYDVKWLDLALTLQRKQDQLFWDAAAGRYRTGTTLPESIRGLLVESDEELPSANAITSKNLLRLSTLTGNETWASRPAMIFHSFGGRLRNDGVRLPQLAAAYELSLMAPSIVVVTGPPRNEETLALIAAIREKADARRALVLLPNKGPARERVTKTLPFTAALAPDPERPIAYVCANGECRRQ